MSDYCAVGHEDRRECPGYPLCGCDDFTPISTSARPEGETPPCQCGHALNQHLLAGGHCEQRGCACRLFVIPLPPARERGEATPAPASGEEELAWLRIRDVRQPQSGKSRCCGTWELVEPALVISVRERDAILARDARLTARIAELEREPRPLPAGLATVEALLDYVQSAGVENPEPIRQRLRAALRAERERVVRWCWKEWSGGMRYDFDEEAEVTRALADLDKEATR